MNMSNAYMPGHNSSKEQPESPRAAAMYWRASVVLPNAVKIVGRSLSKLPETPEASHETPNDNVSHIADYSGSAARVAPDVGQLTNRVVKLATVTEMKDWAGKQNPSVGTVDNDSLDELAAARAAVKKATKAA